MVFNNIQGENNLPLWGLVLAGGRSIRMGRDKGSICYHKKTQREHLGDLLNQYCEETFLSIRAKQKNTLSSSYPFLVDQYKDLGPFGALLTAFNYRPNVGWLVVACDMPLVDQEVIEFLIQKRQPNKIATAFRNVMYEFPEPLITIWEPSSFLILKKAMINDVRSLKKVLQEQSIHLLNAPFPKKLSNVNRPDELAKIQNFLKLNH